MAHSYTVEKFLKVPTEWHPPRRDAEGNWIDPRDDLLPGCAIQCNTWLNEYNACANRIAQRNDDKGNCQAQYEEFAMCQDHCVTHHVFHYLRVLEDNILRHCDLEIRYREEAQRIRTVSCIRESLPIKRYDMEWFE